LTVDPVVSLVIVCHPPTNRPSRGAKKDKEIMDDEEEIIRKMDEAKEQSKAAHKH